MMTTWEVSDDEKRLSITFPSTLIEVDKVVQFTKSWMQKYKYPCDLFSLELVLREGLCNAVLHGNQSDHRKLVHFFIIQQKDHHLIGIQDEGEGFDWEAQAKAEVPLDSESGRGILLMRAYGYRITRNRKGNLLMLSSLGVPEDPLEADASEP
jgi:serine/threonine-protein kinase RsbW